MPTDVDSLQVKLRETQNELDETKVKLEKSLEVSMATKWFVILFVSFSLFNYSHCVLFYLQDKNKLERKLGDMEEDFKVGLIITLNISIVLHTTRHYSTLLHTTILHYTPHHFTQYHTNPHHSIPLHSTPYHFTLLHTTSCHSIPLHSTPYHFIPLHIRCVTIHQTIDASR